MIRGTAILGAGFVLVASAGAYVWMADAAGSGPGAMPKDVEHASGEALYAENCAACHGANLEGRGDWQGPSEDGRPQAPPHDETGHAWHQRDQVLFEYTKLGGRALMAAQGMEFDRGMPGFGEQLSDQEIWNILVYIKSTWPERVMEMQAVRSQGETRKKEI